MFSFFLVVIHLIKVIVVNWKGMIALIRSEDATRKSLTMKMELIWWKTIPNKSVVWAVWISSEKSIQETVIFSFSKAMNRCRTAVLKRSWNSVDLINLSSFAISYNESHLSNCIASCFTFQEMMGWKFYIVWGSRLYSTLIFRRIKVYWGTFRLY